MDWGMNEWIAAGSAAIALLSLVLNWLVIRRQTSLQFESLKAQVDAEVLDWAQEAINILSECVALAQSRGAAAGADNFRARALDLSHKLSAIADRGRLFFPNENPEALGLENEAAFQGVRPSILDALIFACCQVEYLDRDGDGPDEEAAGYFVRCRRLLVSEAQNAIDPRIRATVLKQLALGRLDDAQSSYDVVTRLHADLDSRFPNRPTLQAWQAARALRSSAPQK